MRKVGLPGYALNILISVRSIMQLWCTSHQVFCDSFLLAFHFLCREQSWKSSIPLEQSQSTLQWYNKIIAVVFVKVTLCSNGHSVFYAPTQKKQAWRLGIDPHTLKLFHEFIKESKVCDGIKHYIWRYADAIPIFMCITSIPVSV